ncbi:MAG: UDP-N-acetylmuramoyl-tripeptide--D-alanyl-D-alanine ligase [Candidatus Rifleibacteriota bacterium]
MNDWTPDLVAKACKGILVHNADSRITGFSTDTRTLKQGNVFFALAGENFNGHKFIKSAIDKGAAGIVVSESVDLPGNKNFFQVEVSDCLMALQECAAYYRNNHSGVFIGVTGSNGKTTTRSMLAHLLSAKHRCSSTSGNLNNHIGLPLTILATPPEAEYIVLEMGMNHAGEIRTLCNIAKPDAALINNIGPAHIGILGSLENIARAKAEILEQLPENAPCIVPADTDFTELFKKVCSARLQTFGFSKNADFKIENLTVSIDNVKFKLAYLNESAECEIKLAGKHNAANAAAALALYRSLGFNLDEGTQLLSSFTAVNARMEVINRDGVKILLDCYNANPASMQEALNFLSICPGEKIAVLGDMKELGNHSARLHFDIGKFAAKLGCSCIITVGDEAVAIAEGALESGMHKNSVISLNSTDQAAELLKGKLKTGASILFKASRGMHFEKIVRKLWPGLAEDLH